MQNVAMRSARIRNMSLGLGDKEVSVTFVSVKE